MKERLLKLSLGRSVLFRRMILLIFVTVLLSGLLSAGIYIFVAQRMYADIRAKELLPIARTVADMMTDTQQPGVFFDRGNNSFGAALHIYDADGASVTTERGKPGEGGKHDKPPKGDSFDLTEADTLTMISADLKTVMGGDEVSTIRKSPDGESFLVVGVPAEGGGAVIFTKAMRELSDTMNGLNATLMISTLAAFIIMLIPAYMIARRLVIPIRQMQNVARSMAEGDFSVRADESIKGEIGELGASMNFFAMESERLHKTRQDYVANVSHELRTPVAAVRAMGETLRDGMAKTEEKRQLFYNNIVRESMRLSRLVDDLLELSRLQAGTEAMQKTHFDLREVLQNIVDGYGHLAMDAKLQFSLKADMSAPIPVLSNADRVEQVLVALMDNAIKHTTVGGQIVLSCDPANGDRNMLSRGKSDGGQNMPSYSKSDGEQKMLSFDNAGAVSGGITVSVTNTGAAIPEEDLPFIFERFYTVDKAHSGGGTGLGLSIAKEITHGLGENIWVESGAEETKFSFTLSS